MLDLFYLLGIVPIVLELRGLFFPRATIEIAGNINAEFDKNTDPKKVDLNEKERKFLFYELGYIAWIVIGIIIGIFMGTYWTLFISIIVFSMIPKKNLLWVILDSVISILTISAIIFLHFYNHG